MFNDGILIMSSLRVLLPVTLLDTVGIIELSNPFFIELVYVLPEGFNPRWTCAPLVTRAFICTFFSSYVL
jgi:hypothetical protein